MPAIDIPTLANDLAALSGSALGKALAQLRTARDSLQAQVIAGNAPDPASVSNDFTLVNTWIRTLEAAVQPAPPPDASAALLSAMQAVDTAAAKSGALNNLLTSVNGLVTAAG